MSRLRLANYTITKTQINFEFSKLLGEGKTDSLIEMLIAYKLLKKGKDADTFISDVPLNQLVQEFQNSGLLDAIKNFSKQANHVSPAQHEEVNKYITDSKGQRSQEQKASEVYLLAKRLIQDLPLVPTNERVYDLSQDIEIGLFDDISDPADAYNNWDTWLDRTTEILKGKGILVASKLKKSIKTALDDTDYYQEAEKFISSIKGQPDAKKKLSDEILNHIKTCTVYAVALTDEGFKAGLIDKGDYNEFYDFMNIHPDSSMIAELKVKRLKKNNIE